MMEFHPIRAGKPEEEEIRFCSSFAIESAHIAPVLLINQFNCNGGSVAID
jgi:hypothetical protein